MSQKYLIRIAELERLLSEQAEALRQKDQQLSLVEETEAFLRFALTRAEEKIEEDEREIEHLRAQIEKLRRMLFGTRSEKLRREVELAEALLKQREQDSDRYSGREDDPQVPRQLRQSRHRRPLPAHLPREIHRLEPEESCCPECGGELDYLGEVSAEQLELVSSALKVIRTERVKKACTKCDCIVEAPAPSRPIERGIASPGSRRKIHDVYISSKSATTEEALKRISELYAIEDEIRGLPESERLAVRQQRSKVLLTSLHEWMVEKNGTLSKKSRLGEAFSYVLNQWDALCYYSDDGLAEADNNAAERALRAVCLGKKNFMFFGSDHGGERGALLYGLIGTCRLNGIDPEAYLRHILSVLPEWPSNRVDELLPWNVVLTNK
ncbi:transposase [Escherichia coli]|nr:transposase [Escherichia coli]EKP8935990.1 transposase [Escherichia coli]EKP9860954.1 transposase [Escherichia coli]EKY5579432.1 transposase [Escherichia coli]ELJ0265730.1 transposase [Escherichia coli]